MPRILTVDDSRAIRSIVSKQLVELGYEVDEAEDGEQGLARLEECVYDLIVLDVTMPVLDGPGMLKRMRDGGNKTPVLMLTSESKRSIIADVMKLGIEDYILKPFKPEEMRAKLVKILKVEGAAAAPAAAAAAAPAASPQASSRAGGDVERIEGGKTFVDVLVVDDMENVQKKLRALLPQHLTQNACASAQSALSMCRERVFRVILVDMDIPDVNSVVLLGQLRLVQPHAAFIALALRSENDSEKELREQGFDGVLFKPFDKDIIDDFLMRYFDNQDLLATEDNLLTINEFTGKPERFPRYFQKLGDLTESALKRIAAACFDDVIIDLSKMPLPPNHVPKLAIHLQTQAKQVGISLRLVGPTEARSMLGGFKETASIAFYDSISAARSAA